MAYKLRPVQEGKTMGNILIIDDDVIVCKLLASHCEQLEHDVASAGTIEEGKCLLSTQPVDIVCLDVHLPDGNGLEMLPFIQDLPSSPEVIIITGTDEDDGADLAITNGAWDYLHKPLSRQEIMLQIRRAMEYHAKKMQRTSHINLKRDEIIGDSRAIRDCLDQVANCAGTDEGVLITGETGTGKELFAKAIHANSLRSNGPFVVVDCASLPEKLVETILFGHIKGAFTGASSDQKGLVEQADGGTLFLDEAGELPLETQKSFLRVLQEKAYRPVGEGSEHKSNFRLIAATNRDLSEMVTKGLFRSDLYYRLNAFNIHLPPLRKREKDIGKLVMACVFTICQRNQLPIKGVLPETLEMLVAYPWPGNVRELENRLGKAIISDPKNPVIYPIHLPAEIRLHYIRTVTAQRHEQRAHSPLHEPLIGQGYLSSVLPPFKEYRRILCSDAEKSYLERLMADTDGKITSACKISGLSRSRLYGLLKFHSLTSSTIIDPEK
jgi:two-component system NtrC family response regulator